jgi:hypothetical protein
MIKKIYYIVLLTIFQITNCYSQPSWEKVKTPTDFNLLKVFYLDSLHCWAAGDSGVILFSSDQGFNWDIQNSGVNNYIEDIYFLDDSLGWAVTFELEGINFDIRSKILKTTNGGINWEKINYRHLNFILTSIYFLDSLNGWIGAKPSGISYTTDGGYNWVEANIDTGGFANFPIEQIKFSTPYYGFAVGGKVDAIGAAWSSSDGGDTWLPHGIGPDLFLDFVFLDSTNVISLTAELEGFYPTAVLKFDLLKNSWEYTDTQEYIYVTGMDWRTPSEIWGAAGHNAKSFFVSRDTLKTLELIPTPDSLLALDIDFADSLHGIAVGEGGYIFRYVPDSPVIVNEPDQKIVDGYRLEQNYPNPFNPSSKISWQSPVGSWQTLKIYDVLGNEIVTLVDEYKQAGSYSIEFNMQNLPAGLAGLELSSGIYFYQLITGNPSTSSGKVFVETKKMLLLK